MNFMDVYCSSESWLFENHGSPIMTQSEKTSNCCISKLGAGAWKLNNWEQDVHNFNIKDNTYNLR